MSRSARKQQSWRSTLILSLLLVSICSACSPEPGDERFVRRYFNVLGSEPEAWQPESAMPAKPQKRPFNVVWEVTRYRDAEPTEAQQQAG